MATKTRTELWNLKRGQEFWVDDMHFEFIKMDGLVAHAKPLNKEAKRAIPHPELPAWIPAGMQVEV